MSTLYIVFLLAFLIRLVNLNQSFWLDEATTAKVVLEYDYRTIVTQFSPTDFHPPLYYLFIKLWTSIAGTSEIALRMPSVLFSLAAGYFVYLSGKVLKSEKVGLWAAVFFLFNPLVIYYSQEARMYMMAACWIAATLYYLLLLEKGKENERTNLIGINVSMFLAFSTFYGSIFFLSGIFTWFLLNRNVRMFFLAHVGLTIAVLIHLSLLYKQYLNAKAMLQVVTNWSLVLGKASIKNLVLFPLKFFGGRISFEPKIVYFAVTGLWSLFVMFLILPAVRKYRLLTYLILYPIALAFVFSFFSPLLQYFRFTYLLIPISLLLAMALVASPLRFVVLAGFLVYSAVYLLIPQFHREDWRSIARSIPSNDSVYMISSFTDPVRYYKPDAQILPFDTMYGPDTPATFTVIPYGAAIYGVSHEEQLKKKGYTLTEKRSERGIQVERWSR
jgi:4-amino-4-deoxy-L-arabinose transferase-like glycosyltransferase